MFLRTQSFFPYLFPIPTAGWSWFSSTLYLDFLLSVPNRHKIPLPWSWYPQSPPEHLSLFHHWALSRLSKTDHVPILRLRFSWFPKLPSISVLGAEALANVQEPRPHPVLAALLNAQLRPIFIDHFIDQMSSFIFVSSSKTFLLSFSSSLESASILGGLTFEASLHLCLEILAVHLHFNPFSHLSHFRR